jgi:hypothetical protein
VSPHLLLVVVELVHVRFLTPIDTAELDQVHEEQVTRHDVRAFTLVNVSRFVSLKPKVATLDNLTAKWRTTR